MEITYLGHSAFEIKTNNNTILIDPFLICSPHYDYSNVTDIFVTHGHGDHLGSAIEISKQTGAQITCIFELANYCSTQGANANGIGLGAWLNFAFGKVIFLPAFHSSSTPNGIYTGCPTGILFEIENKRFFHAGDTALNSEMKLLKELYKPDITMLPIGGTFTMDIEHATIAAEWIGANTVIPMHYNTFDAIKANVNEFADKIQMQNKQIKIMNIAETIKF